MWLASKQLLEKFTQHFKVLLLKEMTLHHGVTDVYTTWPETIRNMNFDIPNTIECIDATQIKIKFTVNDNI